MLRLPPRFTRTATLLPSTTLVRAGLGRDEPHPAMASAVGRASGRASVTMRALLFGSASGILLAACFLPLLWPLVGLSTGGRGVHLGLVADQIGRAHV